MPTHLLTTDNDLLEINLGPDNVAFYLLNTQQVGYYRVNYDIVNWNAIKETLKKDVNAIHVLNRAQIVDDLFNLAEAGYLDYGFTFDILEYLTEETEYQPWKSALRGLDQLERMNAAERLSDDYSKLFEVI